MSAKVFSLKEKLQNFFKEFGKNCCVMNSSCVPQLVSSSLSPRGSKVFGNGWRAQNTAGLAVFARGRWYGRSGHIYILVMASAKSGKNGNCGPALLDHEFRAVGSAWWRRRYMKATVIVTAESWGPIARRLLTPRRGKGI